MKYWNCLMKSSKWMKVDPFSLKHFQQNTCLALFLFLAYFGCRLIFSIDIHSFKCWVLSCSCLQIFWIWIWCVLKIHHQRNASTNVYTFYTVINSFQAFQNPGADIGIIIYVTTIAITNLYFYCYFGDYTSNTFKDYPRYLFESNWYKLPIEYQKYFILIIASSQRPLTYDGFRLVSLNLETFLKVTPLHRLEALSLANIT